MSESGPSSAGGVADDLRLHIQSCRRGAPMQTKAAVEEQVSSLMSETGIVYKFLKGKWKVYDSDKPYFKSFCICDEAKLVKVDKPTDVKEIKQKHFQEPSNLLGETQLLTRSPVVSNKRT
ncbi:unnamed protein product [Orchesella dallaii]|uniref:Uncharacterized protein n=1 Tax=Orchesella dallaii TaxID=48710 RepID=A0ABP1RBI9_9HEXA